MHRAGLDIWWKKAWEQKLTKYMTLKKLRSDNLGKSQQSFCNETFVLLNITLMFCPWMGKIMCMCVCVHTLHVHFSGKCIQSIYQILKGVCDTKKIKNPWVSWPSCSNIHFGVLCLTNLRRHESWNSACLLLFYGTPSCFDNTKMSERKETQSTHVTKSANTTLDVETKPHLLSTHQRTLSVAIRLLFKFSSQKEDIS